MQACRGLTRKTYIIVFDWEEDEAVLVLSQERLANILFVLLDRFSGCQSLLNTTELVWSWNLSFDFLYGLQAVKEVLAGKEV
jgi:hypothetical protein